MKIIRWMDKHFEECLMILCLAAVTVVMFIQVIIRKLPWIPALTWAEEFCRFAWIWSVFLSLPYTIKHCSMLRVTAIMDILPAGARRVLDIAVDGVIIAVMAMLMYYAVPLMKDRYISGETSPAMGWPMWVMYSFMILGFGLGVFRGIQRMAFHAGRCFRDEDMSGEKADGEGAL
ncbi:MAG: TRAP transporter small permease [Clostridia bacterium]|nr:TRAP transporter small permease [Clostridia bacterium]